LQRDEAQQVAAGDDADQWGELFEVTANCHFTGSSTASS
jgi:hypothetical protein